MPSADPATDRPEILNRAIGDYLAALGSDAPTPGGGSVGGLLGALGCGLGLMVVAFTRDAEGDAATELRDAAEELERLGRDLPTLAQRDEAAYGGYRDASALPKATPEQKAERRARLQTALVDAATVPLETGQAAVALAEALLPVLRHGNPRLRSDARIALVCARACLDASRINVEANLGLIRDEAFVADVHAALNDLDAAMRVATDRFTVEDIH